MRFGMRKTSRAARHWIDLALSVVLLLAVFTVVQMIAERHNVRFDLTPSRRLSLSAATKKILAEVKDSLSMDVFYRRDSRGETADLLGRLVAENPRIHYRLFDIDRYPERARSAGVRHSDRARVSYHGLSTVVSTASEEYLAGGILRVVRGKRRKIFFLTGHGERPLGGEHGEHGYGRIVNELRGENAEAALCDLGTEGAVPEDADAVVMAGPRRDLFPEEVEALEAYLNRGGALLALVNPGRLPVLEAFLARYGVLLGNDILVDRRNRILGAEDLVVRVPHYRMHAVTAPMDAPALFVGARTVASKERSAGVDTQVVARAVESAWATPEIEAARRGEVSYRAKRDKAGPNPVMVAVSLAAGEDSGRLVVIGDSDFATNEYVDHLGNRDLVLNTLSWLTDEDALITRRPRELAEIARPLSPLILTERQAHMIFVTTVIAEPVLLLALGTIFVVARRRRG